MTFVLNLILFYPFYPPKDFLFQYSNNTLHSQDILKNTNSQLNSDEKEKKSKLELEFLKKGEEHFFKKRFLTSEIYFLRVIEINPENSIAHSYLGEIYLANKQYEKAIHHFKIASELRTNPNFNNKNASSQILFLNSLNSKEITIPIKEYFRLSQSYFLLNEYPQSEEYCKRIINTHPDFFQCYYYLGMIQFKHYKNREKTLQFFKQYHEGLTKFIEENRSESQTLILEKKKVEDVISYLMNPTNLNETLILELDPLNLFYKRSEIENSQNEIQKNIIKIINQKPEFTIPSEKYFDPIWLEILYNKKHDKHKSLQQLQEYKLSKDIKSAKEQYYIRKTLCDIHFELKQYEEAEKECKEALLFDFEPEILFYLSMITKQLNKKNEFYEYSNKYLKYKNDIKMLFLIAHDLFEDQRFNESLVYFEKILQIQPNHKESLYYLIKIYKEFYQIDAMKNIIKKIDLYYPEDYELIRYSIFELLEKEEYELSKELLYKLYKKTKSLNDGLTLVGILLNQNQEEKAFEIIGELYQNYPTNYHLVRTIIILLKKLNRNYDSIEHVVKNFISQSNNEEEKEKILEILPEEIKKKFQTNGENNIKN